MACSYPAERCSVNPHDPRGHFIYLRFNIPDHFALLFPKIEVTGTPYISELGLWPKQEWRIIPCCGELA